MSCIKNTLQNSDGVVKFEAKRGGWVFNVHIVRESKLFLLIDESFLSTRLERGGGGEEKKRTLWKSHPFPQLHP